MLMRHWSLFESLKHSTYIAHKLGLLKNRRLANLLANSGLSLRECHKMHVNTKQGFKNDIEAMLSKWSARYGMSQLAYPSFDRNCGLSVECSASDVVYSVQALLDYGCDDAHPVLTEKWISNFHWALDALTEYDMSFI